MSLNVIPVVLTTTGKCTLLTDSLNDHFGRCEVYKDKCMQGAAISTQNAIMWASSLDIKASVLFCEDDILLSPRFGNIVKGVRWDEHPGVGVISFCDMREVAEGSDGGYHKRSAMGSCGGGWWGNQCLLIHPLTARELSHANWWSTSINTSRPIRAHAIRYGDDGRNASDIRMSMVVHNSSRPFYSVYVPSLALHVGHESRCFPGRTMGERATRNPDIWFLSRPEWQPKNEGLYTR